MRALRIGVQLVTILSGAVLLTFIFVPYAGFTEAELSKRFLNFVPLAVVGLLAFCVNARVFTTLGLLAVCAAVLAFLHRQKMAYLGAPLTIDDASIAHLVFVSPSMAVDYIGWLPLLVSLASVMVLGVVSLRELPAMGARHRFLFGTALAVLFVITAGPLRQLYSAAPAKPWEADPTQFMGLPSFLVRDFIDTRLTETPVADAKMIARYSATRPLAPFGEHEVERPDIVVWLSESFFDPGELEGIAGCTIIPAYCEIAREYDGGTIAVPTFGGRTVRTEFEILTGVPMSAIPAHSYPYMSLTNRPINSIAWKLQENGYETSAFHNHKRGFWRRPTAFKNLGISNWRGIEDFESKSLLGTYHADRYLTSEVVRFLDRTEDSGPQFVFAISMQAHGPYGRQKGLPEQAVADIPVPETLDSGRRATLRQFLFHMSSVDDELLRLKQYVMERHKPTIVLYFGDHLPGMLPVFQALEFRNGKPAWTQPTPYLLFSNHEVGRSGRWSGDLAAWQLPTLLLAASRQMSDGVFARFRQIFDLKGWSASMAADCSDEACSALRNYQYSQLAGPIVGNASAP